MQGSLIFLLLFYVILIICKLYKSYIRILWSRSSSVISDTVLSTSYKFFSQLYFYSFIADGVQNLRHAIYDQPAAVVLLQGGSADLEQQCLQMYCCKTVQLTWKSSVYKCIAARRFSWLGTAVSTNVLLQGGSIDLEQQCLQMYCCKTVQLTWNSSVYKCIAARRFNWLGTAVSTNVFILSALVCIIIYKLTFLNLQFV